MYLNLKVQLWKTGIRQNQLARMLDLDEAILSKIVNGFRSPSPELRVRIAALLRSDEAWLFQPYPQQDEPPEKGAPHVNLGSGE